MGESYKGLTIRIGADTTSLQKSLKAVSAAATSTQKELRKITSGLKLDPSNVALVSAKLTALGEQAQAARTKFQQLDQVNKGLSSRYVSDLTNGMKNVHAYTERARDGFNKVNAELEQVNRKIEYVQKTLNSTKLSDANYSALETTLKNLQARWKTLSAAHQEYQKQLEGGMEAERIRDMRVELQSAAAATKNAVTQMSKMVQETGELGSSVRRINDVREELEKIDSVAEELRREFSTLDDALKLDPTDPQAAAKAMKNLAEQSKLAETRLKYLNDEIDALKKSGIDDAGKSMSELRSDTRLAAAQFEELQQQVAEASAELDKLLAEQRKLDGSAVDKTREDYVQLAAKIDKAKEKLEQLETAARNSTKSLDTAAAREQLRKLQTEAEQTRTELKQLSDTKVNIQTTGGTTASGVSGSTLRSMGSALSNVGVYTQMAGSYVIDSAETIDSAFRDMKKTVQGTDEEFDALRQAAIDFSKTHVTSADTILEIEAMGGQLGISVDKLEEFASVASNLDIATDIDADDIAQRLGQFNNILDWGEGDMERFGDALVRLGNNMPAQESAIVDITARIGAAGSMYGMTTPQILAWSTAIAATGQNSEAAGTAVSNSLSYIENAVASGGDNLEKLAGIAGMTSEEFANMWNADASGAFEAFVQGLAQIEASGESSDVALTDLGITAVRQKQALKGLAQTTDVLDSSLQMSEDAWNGVADEWGDAGDAAREAAQKSEGFSGAMGMLRNTAAALGDTIGEALLPFIEQLTDILSDADEWFSGLSEGEQQAVILVAALTPVAGVALNVAGAMLQLKTTFNTASAEGSKLKTALQQIKTGFTNGTTAMGKFSGAMGGIKSLLMGGLQTLLVTLAVAGVAYLAKKFLDAKEKAEKFKKATEGLEGACGASKDSIRDLADIMDEFGTSTDDVCDQVDNLIDKSAELAGTISERNSELSTSNGLLTDYGTVIDELAGKSNLTSEQVALLKWAVDGLNEQCETNYSVAQDQAGAYQIMSDNISVTCDEIDRLIEKMKLQAQMDVLQANYTDVVAQENAMQQAAVDAYNAYNAKKREIEEKTANGDYMHVSFGLRTDYEEDIAELNQLHDAISEAASGSDSLAASEASLSTQMGIVQEAISGLGNGYTDLISNNSALFANLDLTKYTVDQFATAIENSGISLEQFGSMISNGDLQGSLIAMATDFDGSTQSIIASLLSMDGQFSQAVESGQISMEQLAACFDAEGNGIPEKITEFADTLTGLGLDSAAEYVTNFATSLSNGAGEVSDAANTITDATEQVMDEGVTEAGETGTETGEEYAGSVEGESGTAEAAGESVGSSAVSGLDAGSSGAYSSGQNVTQGFINGMASLKDQAYAAGYSVGQQGTAGVNAGSGVHSPSKITRQTGRFIDQGLIIGMEELSGDAVKSAYSMASATVNAVRKAYAGYDFAGMAASAAYGYNKAQATFNSAYSGLSKADAYDAFDSAIKSNAGTEVAVYVDGKKLASTIATDMDSELGTLATRRAR